MQIRSDEEYMNELYMLRGEHAIKQGLCKSLEYKTKLGTHPVYQYAYYEILAFFLYYNDYFEDSFNVYKKLHYHCPIQKIIDTCDYNIHFPATRVVDKYIEYNPENVERWANYFNRDTTTTTTTPTATPKLITITTTTCKRLELFKKTVNSFIECCLDYDKFEIDKWLVIDDNSSDEDREEMKRLYPFMTFIYKTPAQKGHARSINMMLRHVNTPYLFHLEDDWQFYYKDNYFTHLYQVIQENDSYKQVLLNNMYSEIPEHETFVGGHWKRTVSEPALNYIEHEYTATQDEQIAFNQRWQFKPNCSYWPHYSFRPGLSDMTLFKTIGDFNEDVWHFEMNYAHKYVKEGYKTVFLPGMVCKHIGKLTSDKDGINAYVLNEERQFYGEKKITFMKRLSTYYVNLDRRPDRRELFEKTMINISLPITRYSAVDGYALKMSPQMYHLFDKNDYNYRKGIVGCALSHINIWIKHYYDEISNQRDFLMVMEDDLYFPEGDSHGFEDKIESSLEYMENNNLDLLFVQYTPRNPKTPQPQPQPQPQTQTLPPQTQPQTQPQPQTLQPQLSYHHVDALQALQYSYGGTGCYIITKNGIKKMLDFINTHGMTNAIDTVMQKSANFLKIAYLEPLLVVLDMDKEGDTDIQFNFESCAQNDTIQLIKDEIKYLNSLGYSYKVDYVISKFHNDFSEYSYPLKDAFVLFKIKPSDILLKSRPRHRLYSESIVDGKYVFDAYTIN